LVLYRGFINCLRLVTFPIATVFIVVFIVTFCCIFIKLLSTRRYLLSFFGHFCPTGVNTKEYIYSWGWIPKAMMDIYTQRNQFHRWDRYTDIGKRYYWRKQYGRPHTREQEFEIENYRDYFIIQSLARLVAYLELLRYLIRPVSLSLRLVANISCRHILMVLAVGSAGFNLFTVFGPVLFVCALETLVCFVQCYVFYTLWTMYMEE